MSRNLFAAELGIHLLSQNSDTGVMLLFGSVLPGAMATFDDDAEVGSIYFRTNGSMFQKKTAGTGTDKWVRMANADDLINLTWRPEKVIALTVQAAPVSGSTIDLAVNPLTGDEGTLLVGADFPLNSFILFGSGGTPKIMQITNVAGDVITVSDPTDPLANPPLANGYAYFVKYYLPDSPGTQENSALVVFNGADYVKIGDVDWNVATGINLSSGYSAASGDVSNSDTVETAIQKLDGVNDAQDTSLGLAQGALNFGTFTGALLPDNNSAKQLFQVLETKSEELDERAPKRTLQSGVTTEVTLDSLVVDDYQAAKWLVTISLDSAPARKVSMEVHAAHNGHAAADANDTDDTIYSLLRIGSPFQYALLVDLNGAGAGQSLRLRVSSNGGPAITAKATRIEVAGV